MAKKKQVQSKDFSYLSKEAMGGLHGGMGYHFQNGYIVCLIAKLLAQDTFLRLMPEGSGDVDIVSRENDREVLEHVQVKDNNVTNSAFLLIVRAFFKIDQGTGNVYKKFTLVSPSVSPDIKQLWSYLDRYRKVAEGLFNGNTKALKTTEVELKRVFKKLKLEAFADFILKKVDFEVGDSNFGDNTICKHLFISRLAEHPKYKKQIHEFLSPAFSVLSEAVSSHNGKILHSGQIHSLIDSALINAKPATSSTTLHIHNWTSEKFDSKPNYKLDWSKYFQRENKKVPDTKIWNEVLIPQLNKIKIRILKKTSNRHIIFRGKCALSTGVAIGCTFPEIGNWSFEIIQPPKGEVWRSDIKVTRGYKLKWREMDFRLKKTRTDKDLAFVFDISADAIKEVTEYLVTNHIAVKKIIVIEPKGSAGTLSIKNNEEALSLASASKDVIKQMIQKYAPRTSHLFFYGPLGLSIFLGQKLTSVGTIQLYEFQSPSYKPSCLIKT